MIMQMFQSPCWEPSLITKKRYLFPNVTVPQTFGKRNVKSQYQNNFEAEI